MATNGPTILDIIRQAEEKRKQDQLAATPQMGGIEAGNLGAFGGGFKAIGNAIFAPPEMAGKLLTGVDLGYTEEVNKIADKLSGKEEVEKEGPGPARAYKTGDFASRFILSAALIALTKGVMTDAAAGATPEALLPHLEKLDSVSPFLGKALAGAVKSVPRMVQATGESVILESTLADNPSPKGVMTWIALDGMLRSRTMAKMFDKLFARNAHLRGPVTDIWDAAKSRWLREGDLGDETNLLLKMVSSTSEKTGVGENEIMHHLFGSAVSEYFRGAEFVPASKAAEHGTLIFSDGSSLTVKDARSAIKAMEKLSSEEGITVEKVVGSKSSLNGFKFDFLSQTPEDINVAAKVANEEAEKSVSSITVSRLKNGKPDIRAYSMEEFTKDKELRKAIQDGEAQIISTKGIDDVGTERIIDWVWRSNKSYRGPNGITVLPTSLRPRVVLEDGSYVEIGSKKDLIAEVGDRKITGIRVPNKTFYDPVKRNKFVQKVLGAVSEERPPAGVKTPVEEAIKTENITDGLDVSAAEGARAPIKGVDVTEAATIQEPPQEIVDYSIKSYLRNHQVPDGIEIKEHLSKIRESIMDLLKKLSAPGEKELTSHERELFGDGMLYGLFSRLKNEQLRDVLLKNRQMLVDVLGAGESFRLAAFLDAMPEDFLKHVRVSAFEAAGEEPSEEILAVLKTDISDPLEQIVAIYNGAGAVDVLEEIWHSITLMMDDETLTRIYNSLPKKMRRFDPAETIAKAGLAFNLKKAVFDGTAEVASWFGRMNEFVRAVYDMFLKKFWGESPEIERIFHEATWRESPRTVPELRELFAKAGDKYPPGFTTLQKLRKYTRSLFGWDLRINSSKKLRSWGVRVVGRDQKELKDVLNSLDLALDLSTKVTYDGVDYFKVRSSTLIGDSARKTYGVLNPETGEFFTSKPILSNRLYRLIQREMSNTINVDMEARVLPGMKEGSKLQKFVKSEEEKRFRTLAQTFSNMLNKKLPTELRSIVDKIKYRVTDYGTLQIQIPIGRREEIDTWLEAHGLALNDVIRLAKLKAEGVPRGELLDEVMRQTSRVLRFDGEGKGKTLVIHINEKLKGEARFSVGGTAVSFSTKKPLANVTEKVAKKLSKTTRITVRDPEMVVDAVVHANVKNPKLVVLVDKGAEDIKWVLTKPSGELRTISTDMIWPDKIGVLPSEVREAVQSSGARLRVLYGNLPIDSRYSKVRVMKTLDNVINAVLRERRQLEIYASTFGVDSEKYAALLDLSKKVRGIPHIDPETGKVSIKLPGDIINSYESIDEAIGALENLAKDHAYEEVFSRIPSGIPDPDGAMRQLDRVTDSIQDVPKIYERAIEKAKSPPKALMKFFDYVYAKVLQPLRSLTARVDEATDLNFSLNDLWEKFHQAKRLSVQGVYEDIKDIIPSVKSLSEESKSRVKMAISAGLGREHQLETSFEKITYENVMKALSLTPEEEKVGRDVAKWFDDMGSKYIFESEPEEIAFIQKYDPFKDTRYWNQKPMTEEDVAKIRRRVLSGQVPTDTIIQNRTGAAQLSGEHLSLERGIIGYASAGNKIAHLNPIILQLKDGIRAIEKKGLLQPEDFLAKEALESLLMSVTNAYGTHGAYVYAALENSLLYAAGTPSQGEKFMKFLIDSGYMAGVGFRPATAVKNLLQMGNTFVILGRKHFSVGFDMMMKALKGRDPELLKLLDPIYAEWASPYEEELFKHLAEMSGNKHALYSRFRNASMALMRKTEMINRSVTFFGGLKWAEDILKMWKSEGMDALPRIFSETPMAVLMEPERNRLIQYLHEGEDALFSKEFAFQMVANTQWIYGAGEGSLIGNSKFGRVFLMFGTWPGNYIDFLKRIMKAAYSEGGLKTVTGKSWGPGMLRRWLMFNATLSGSLATLGVGSSGLTFLSPAEYYGGPFVSTFADFASWRKYGGSENSLPGKRAMRTFSRTFIPGSAAIHDMAKAVQFYQQDEAYYALMRTIGLSPRDSQLRRDLALSNKTPKLGPLQE